MTSGRLSPDKENTMDHYYMGIDLGGTVTKVGLYTAEGKEITVAAQTLP